VWLIVSPMLAQLKLPYFAIHVSLQALGFKTST